VIPWRGSKMFRERFRELSRNGKTFAWDPGEKAGQAAEEEVSTDLLRRFHNTGWRLHRELRVPTRVGRRELDFVITSPNEAFVIELKNWSGRADIDRAGFVTQTRWPSNEVISHGCVLDKLRAKTVALKEHHHRHGEPARELRIRHYLVFWNPRLVMSHALARADGVVRWQQFERNLPRHRSMLTSVLEALARFLGWTERAVSPPVDEIRAFRTTLDRLGTWDWIHLHGGRCIRGDVLEAPRSSILRAPYDRERVRSIDFRIDRAVPPRRTNRGGADRVCGDVSLSSGWISGVRALRGEAPRAPSVRLPPTRLTLVAFKALARSASASWSRCLPRPGLLRTLLDPRPSAAHLKNRRLADRIARRRPHSHRLEGTRRRKRLGHRLGRTRPLACGQLTAPLGRELVPSFPASNRGCLISLHVLTFSVYVKRSEFGDTAGVRERVSSRPCSKALLIAAPSRPRRDARR
jgi:hypothetical protein